MIMHISPFNSLTTRHLHMDFMGGITVAVVALPLALAFGVASGAGPAAGIYGAIFVGFFCCNIWWHAPSGFRANGANDSGNGRRFHLVTGKISRNWIGDRL